MLTIRRRTSADLDGCAEVLRRVYELEGYPVQGIDQPNAFLDVGELPAWVAERDGRVTGHIAVSAATDDDVSVALWREKCSGDDIAVLGRLFVDPGSRGGGAASKLIETASQWASDNNVRLVLFGLTRNGPAIRLYERLGWSNFGKTVFHSSNGKSYDAICFASPER